MIRILYNTIISSKRKSSNRYELATDFTDPKSAKVSSGDWSADDHVYFKEVMQGVDKLLPREKEALMEVCFNENSYEDAANQIAGGSQSALKSRLWRARTRLKKMR
jgi:DNA-directed RNA polymerase specialized sigma24 family protein